MRTIVLCLLLGLTFADEVQYKGAKVKSVAPPAAASVASAPKTSEKKPVSVNQQAERRQDSYGAPQAPSVDTYGSPQGPVQDSYGSPVAPVQDSYGSPQSDPVGPVQQGEVGTQGYYYYYYPVANNYGGATQTYQSHGSSGTSSKGGLLSGGNLGILIFLGLGALVVFALVASFATNNNRALSSGFMDNLDLDTVMYQVYNAIEWYNDLSA